MILKVRQPTERFLTVLKERYAMAVGDYVSDLYCKSFPEKAREKKERFL
jgi:hypothetical protein